MKIFLANLTMYDGEHEHYQHLLIKAKTFKQATALLRSKAVDRWFSYGDDSTALKENRSIQQITDEQAKVLTDLNIVHYLGDL